MKLFLFMAALTAFAGAADETRLLRFPAIHGDAVVFSYAGDLYRVDAAGGVARKLTNHEGYEMFPRFSPDGETIAFTAQYDGNTEVYTMPAIGGAPTRLTYTATLGRDDVSDRMGPNNIVIGWSADGEKILFRSRMQSFNSFNGQLFLVSKDGGAPEELPLPRGGFGSFSADGQRLAYNRVFREFRTWKRYRGGMADDVWIINFQTKALQNLTNHEAQDIIPMWRGDKVYFLSDRDERKRMNLYVQDLAGGEARRLTDFKDFDIKFPSLGKDAIVFENGGYVYRFDLASERAVKIPITVADDFKTGRGALVDVSRSVNDGDIAPDGKRVALYARGDLFTVPEKDGPTRNLTQTSGIHERSPRWSPDGKWIAYISDRSGEDEIHLKSQDGLGEARAITSGGSVYKYSLVWSPDSKKIMWADREQKLHFVDVDSAQVKQVVHNEVWEIRNYVWSPDSQWIAYVKPEQSGFSRIYLYSLQSGESFPATTDWHSSSSPAFSADGKYLIFTSSRDFNPTYSWTEWNHAYVDMSRIYMVALAKDVKSPFALKSDETAIKEEKKAEPPADKDKKKKKGKKAKDEDKKEEKKKDKGVQVKVDRDGLIDRVIDLPIQPSSYSSLTSVDQRIYYQRNGSGDARPKLMMYDLKSRKETELGEVMAYGVSANGKKMVVMVRGGRLALINTPKGKVKPKEFLNLSGMKVKLNRGEEWRQIFNECWRQMRDFFYAPNMHGVDWQAMRERYAPLVDYVNHRNDLTYIIGEMIGELNVGHAYVGGGDRPAVQRINLGLLGARLSRDSATGYWRVDKILKGETWDPQLRSPFRAVGVGVNEGDYILAVNGADVSQMSNIYEALIDQAGKTVTLKVNSKPEAAGARETMVEPISDESSLYYHDWVQTNIRKVAEATDGQVGYVHVPDMSVNGLNEFVKHYYPQLTKRALIIDVRGNGGGNVSPMLIERLRREIAMTRIIRNASPSSNPGTARLGPLVCLMDEFSASDGDIFPYRFKHYGLGKLIGKRSWGGVVGIRGPLPIVDGGDLRKPEFAIYDLEGQNWIVEGYGVDPDIVVDNHPMEEHSGNDQQLNKGIEVILEELKTKGHELKPPPPWPVRN